MAHNIETRLGPLAHGLRSGQIDLQRYLEQLELYFTSENNRTMAFLPEAGRFERLRFEAAALEIRYPDPALRPPLYGVPVGVKDIFHVDGFPTQAGARLPASTLAGLEAESVGRLKQAGALIMGKTVTTEFAYFGPGPTRNPHNPEHTPGGSSSGSAAAVGAGLCSLALGSQTIGSVIRPAAFCGTVGFKPSFGRISTQGVIPISPSLDHIGFFTRDIAGAALAASVLCADWQPQAVPSDKPMLGIPSGPYLDKASAEGLEHFTATVNRLEQAGFIVRRVEALADFDEIVAWHNDLMAGEMARVHEGWFGRYGQWYHPRTAALIERGHQVSLAQIRVYAAGRERLRYDLQALLQAHDISLWISPPATGPAPHGLGSTGDPIMNLPWTNAGLPTINLPAGSAQNGLPMGLQLTGGWQKDAQLFAWAGQIAEVLESAN